MTCHGGGVHDSIRASSARSAVASNAATATASVACAATVRPARRALHGRRRITRSARSVTAAQIAPSSSGTATTDGHVERVTPPNA